jgi:hypothetical protein
MNPVEKFWAWLRRQLKAMDLADLVNKRPPTTKAQLKARVRCLLRSAKAKVVARNYVRGLRNVCLEIIKNKGGASRS